MHKLLLSFGLSLTILGVNSLPILAQSTNSYTRCSTNPNNYCLRRGDRGQLVTELISNLNCVGYFSGANDGIFGSETERGLRNFQRYRGLTVDGIAGPQTRNLLNDECNTSGNSHNRNQINHYSVCPNNPNEYCLRRGDRGELVRELIGNLICVEPSYPLDYPINDTEAVFTEEVERAVRDVQGAAGLSVDGIAGPRTRAVLSYGC